MREGLLSQNRKRTKDKGLSSTGGQLCAEAAGVGGWDASSGYTGSCQRSPPRGQDFAGLPPTSCFSYKRPGMAVATVETADLLQHLKYERYSRHCHFNFT